jgi:hypothetical protein
MTALDGVLADLVEADRECTYVTVRREPLEGLIDQWVERGDRLNLIVCLLKNVQQPLAHEPSRDPRIPQVLAECQVGAIDAVMSATATVLAHHRHAIRQQLGSRVKQVLRCAIEGVGAHAIDAWLAGEKEVAERLESERQTVRIVISTVESVINRLFEEELTAATIKERAHSDR